MDSLKTILLIVSIVALVCAFSLGVGKVHGINEKWHESAQALLRELRDRASWLDGRMNVSRDRADLSSMLDALSGRLERSGDIMHDEVDFIPLTRTVESRAEAEAIARQCSRAIENRAILRQRLCTLMADGTNIMRRLQSLASTEPWDIAHFRAMVNEKSKKLDEFLLSGNHRSDMKEFYDCVDEVAKKRLEDPAWQALEEAHASFGNCTNELAKIQALYSEADERVHELYWALVRFPFDRANASDGTRRRIGEALQGVDALISVGTDLCLNSARRTDAAFTQSQRSAKAAYDALLALREADGACVETSSVASVSRILNAFPRSWKAAQKRSNIYSAEIRTCLDRIQGSRAAAEQTLVALRGNEDASEEQLAHVCVVGHAQAEDLTRDRDALERSISSLTNYLTSVQANARKNADDAVSCLDAVRRGLPDWATKGKYLAKELETIRRDAEKVLNDVSSMQKNLETASVNEREEELVSSVRTRIAAILRWHEDIEDSCTGVTTCLNGSQFSALEKRRDRARELMSMAVQTLPELWDDVKRLSADMKKPAVSDHALATSKPKCHAVTRAGEEAEQEKAPPTSPPPLDWSGEGRKLLQTLDGIRDTAAGLRGEADALKKNLVYYRGNGNKDVIPSLRTRASLVVENLAGIEAACTRTSSCMNEGEWKTLKEQTDRIRASFERGSGKARILFQDLKRFLEEESLRRVRYVAYDQSFASRLNQGYGACHLDLALDISRAGYHKVEIRFCKGKNSLYKVSPYRWHKVVARCRVTGMVNQDFELGWNDSTISWSESVVLEGNFSQGINDVNLDLTLGAVDIHGEPLQGGTWQFQHGGRFPGANLEDNFWIEFRLDGAKWDALLGVPDL